MIVLMKRKRSIDAESATPGLWQSLDGELLIKTHLGAWVSSSGTEDMTPKEVFPMIVAPTVHDAFVEMGMAILRDKLANQPLQRTEDRR